jgi:FlaG/FlaF family flagellin (archaellin)
LSSKSSSVASLSISKSSSRFCKVVNKTIKGLRPGSCHVTLTLRQKSGKKTVGLITVRISK